MFIKKNTTDKQEFYYYTTDKDLSLTPQQVKCIATTQVNKTSFDTTTETLSEEFVQLRMIIAKLRQMGNTMRSVLERIRSGFLISGESDWETMSSAELEWVESILSSVPAGSLDYVEKLDSNTLHNVDKKMMDGVERIKESNGSDEEKNKQMNSLIQGAKSELAVFSKMFKSSPLVKKLYVLISSTTSLMEFFRDIETEVDIYTHNGVDATEKDSLITAATNDKVACIEAAKRIAIESMMLAIPKHIENYTTHYDAMHTVMKVSKYYLFKDVDEEVIMSTIRAPFVVVDSEGMNRLISRLLGDAVKASGKELRLKDNNEYADVFARVHEKIVQTVTDNDNIYEVEKFDLSSLVDEICSPPAAATDATATVAERV